MTLHNHDKQIKPTCMQQLYTSVRGYTSTVGDKLTQPGATHEKAKAIGSTILEIGSYYASPVLSAVSALASGLAPQTAKKTYTFIGKQLQTLWKSTSTKSRLAIGVVTVGTAYYFGAPPSTVGSLLGIGFSSKRVFTPLTGSVEERVEKGLGVSIEQRKRALENAAKGIKQTSDSIEKANDE